MRAKDQKITTCPEAAHYLISAYAKIEAFSEADNAVRSLRYRSLTAQEYADELTEQVLKCGDVFDDYELMCTFVEDLNAEIWFSKQKFLVEEEIDIDARARNARCIYRNHARSQ